MMDKTLSPVATCLTSEGEKNPGEGPPRMGNPGNIIKYIYLLPLSTKKKFTVICIATRYGRGTAVV